MNVVQIVLAVYAALAIGAWLVAVALQAWREGQR